MKASPSSLLPRRRVVLAIASLVVVAGRTALAFSATATRPSVVVAPPAVAPSVVTVCTAELCRCQGEEGKGALDVLGDLRSRDLPYPVEESTCLGACGGGAMVAIDFVDGTSSLASGLDGALEELGLERRLEEWVAGSVAPPGEEEGVVATTTTTGTGAAFSGSDSNPRPIVEATDAAAGDARDRMRAAAASDPPPENPWLNMAGYLAGKVLGK